MELNDTSNDSEWMKQSYSKPSEQEQEQVNKSKTYIVREILKHSCCAKPNIMVINDGNKTQKCLSCGYIVSYK